MSYSNFQTFGLINYTFRLEVDFGFGWEDISDNLDSCGLVEKPSQKICGLITRNITVNLRLEDEDISNKWTKINTPIRLYVSANGFEELIFQGFTTNGTISNNTVRLRILDDSAKKLNTKFGSFASDIWSFNDLTQEFTFPNDGVFLPSGDNEEGGTVQNTNYRPKPINLNLNETQDVSCYLLFNRDESGNVGIHTIDQMLKAMGCFGGYNKDGVFKLKKRPWLFPEEQWDFRDYPINGTFKNLTYDNRTVFNSIDVEGYQFRHFLNNNIYFNFVNSLRSKELLNYEITPPSSTFFLDDNVFEDILVGEDSSLRTLLQLTARVEDDEESTIVDDTFVSERAYDHVPAFDGTSRSGTTGNIPMHLSHTYMMWLRPENKSGNQIIITNENASNRGQGIRINPTNRVIEFVNHGIVALSSNTNFFNWNESFHLTVDVDTANRTIKFYKNGVFVNSRTWTSANDLVASTNQVRIGANRLGTGEYYQGRIQELRITNGNLTDQTIRKTYNRALDTIGIGEQTLDTIRQYWRMNEASGATIFGTTVGENIVVGNNITLNFTIRSVNNLFERLRKWKSDNLAFLSSFSADNFLQTIRFGGFSDTKSYIKRLVVSARGVYRKIQDIKVNASNFDPETELEAKTELKSFYINNPEYAQQLADNLLSVYNNGLGLYSFKIPFQPRLMVGDIILFSTPEGEKKGIVLEKTTSLSKSGFLDMLDVKEIADPENLYLANNEGEFILTNEGQKIIIQI